MSAVERVARAIDQTAFDIGLRPMNAIGIASWESKIRRQRKAMRQARAAIRALREPTQEIVKAMMGETAADYAATDAGRDRLGVAILSWQAAIDAILEGK